MVVLKFNSDDQTELTSKSSKKRVANLNPFFQITDNVDPEPIKVIDPTIPTKVSDLVGMENCHSILKTWYNKSITDLSTKMMIIAGPTGCGKTSLVELFCKENDILIYTVTNNRTKKDLIKEIISFSEYTTGGIFIKSDNIKKLIKMMFKNINEKIIDNK